MVQDLPLLPPTPAASFLVLRRRRVNAGARRLPMLFSLIAALLPQ